jgi:hypothetical protein
VLTNSGLDEARLSGAAADGANFSGATLQAANLEEGDFTLAMFTDANMSGIRAIGAKMAGASLLRVDLTAATLARADLTEVDLRMANLTGVVLTDARLTGAKIAGLIGTGAAVPSVVVEWVDTSTAGDGGGRLSNGEIRPLLSGMPATSRPVRAGVHRYFGKGDSLKNAALEFQAGAMVEIDSFFQNCSIVLGEGTELVLGKEGVLADCKISGGGKITIHGKFFERESPGILGSRELTVTGDGALVAAVEQGETPTRFAFHKGCRLRVKIVRKSNSSGEKGVRQT